MLEINNIYNGDCLELLKKIDDNSIDSIVTDPPYHLTTVKRFSNASIDDNNSTGEAAREGKNQYARLSKGFMGQEWDGGDIAFRTEVWQECLRVLKPGEHLLAFGGSRTYHRMTCAIEDAGFEIRDCIQWLYGSGFPKSHDISKAIDKTLGAEREVVGRKKAPGMAKTSVEQGAQGRSVYEFNEYSKEAITPEAKQWDGWGTALKPAYEPIIMARKPLDSTVAANVLKWGTGGINIDECRIEIIDNLM